MNSDSQVSATSKTLENVTMATTRSALALLAVGAIGLIGIWLANSTRISSDERSANSDKWYADTSQMLCRYRSYERQGSQLYQALALAAIQDEFSEAGLIVDVPCIESRVFLAARNWKALPPGSENVDSDPSSLSWRVRCFGDGVLTTLNKDHTPKEDRLLQVIDTCFPENRLKEMFKQPRALYSLAHFGDSDYWPTALQWIMSGDWPPAMFWSPNGWRETKASFIGQFHYYDRIDLKQRRIYDLLLTAKNKEQVDQILSSAAESAYQAALQTKDQASSPSLSIPGLGSPMKADDALVFLGPLIFLFQASFYLHWKKHDALMKAIPCDPNNEPGSLFPRFSSPVDPLANLNRSMSMEEWCSRTLWYLFLILPSIVLSIAALFRYDLRIFRLRPSIVPHDIWMEQLQQFRSHDPLSTAVDILNLGALAFSLRILSGITVASEKGGRPINYLLKRYLGNLIGLAFLLLWTARAYSLLAGFYRYDDFPSKLDLIIGYSAYLAFGAIWILALKRAILARQPALGFLAIIGVVLSFWTLTTS